MKYLKIQNKGVLPMALFHMMGASTKNKDITKIGEFGTGLKYAMAYCGRTNTSLTVFLGERKLEFGIKDINIRKVEFRCITINGRNTNLTTSFGEKWEAWMAIREIWCNAIDETKPSKSTVEDNLIGKTGYTTFYIGMTDEITKVVDNWDEHFLVRTDAIYENDDIAIYPSEGKTLKIYKNTILIDSKDQDCLFHYDIKKASINELREYRGSIDQDIAGKLLISNEAVVNNVRNQMNRELRDSSKSSFETNLDYYSWSYMHSEEYIEKVKKLFSGKLYIDKRSSNNSKHGIMITNSLLDTLKRCGLKTTTVHYNSGYGYGGSVYADYEIIPHPRLQERLERHIKRLDLSLSFDVMVPVNGSDTDFVYDNHKIIFNTRLEHVDDREMQAIILSAYILDKDKNYVTMRRLIKGMLGNKSRLRTILQL